jgi:hypothetical protein
MLEEMENIKYGNLETAMYYCERNKIGKWINRSLWRDFLSFPYFTGFLAP